MTTTKKATTARAKKPATPRKKAAPAAIPDLPANPFVFEIFDVVSKQRSATKK